MNTLERYFFEKKKKHLIHKWHHYFKAYDNHFKKYIGKNPTILEIGVYKGGSLEMWNNYFGKCTIYAVDISPKCKELEKDFNNVHIYIGDQGDKSFWKEFKKHAPKFDIIIDDGGHQMHEQKVTFKCMYSHMKDNSTYLCEDLHTSYWKRFQAGYKHPNSFIEYTKDFIDRLNAYHIEQSSVDLTFRQTTNSIHYYDSIIVLEKQKDTEKPIATKRH